MPRQCKESLWVCLWCRESQGAPRGAVAMGVDLCTPCRTEMLQRAQLIHPRVTCQQRHLTCSSKGRDFTYLLLGFFGLFVLFSSSEEEASGASTHTGPATSEPQHQKPFSCSINFIGKSVSLGGFLFFFLPSPVTRHEKAH